MRPIVAVTGQHREMLDQVNELFGIQPDHDLDLMVPGATSDRPRCTGADGQGDSARSERPDAVVVQGDTTVGHGRRAGCVLPRRFRSSTSRRASAPATCSSPFPEEGNRRLVAPLARLHLAPTATSRQT